jgi:hypothetical protein
MNRRPHKGIPRKELTDEQSFDRLVYWRSRVKYSRAQYERLARASYAKYGELFFHRSGPLGPRGPGMRKDFTVDADGELRLLVTAKEMKEEKMYKAMIMLTRKEFGNQILDRLPPDTTVDLVTGEVTIDPDKPGWFD